VIKAEPDGTNRLIASLFEQLARRVANTGAEVVSNKPEVPLIGTARAKSDVTKRGSVGHVLIDAR